MYRVANVFTYREITAAAAVIKWLHRHLSTTASIRVPSSSSIRPDWSKLILAGHSRGGKVAFAIARSLLFPLPLPILGVIGMDPTDGVRSSTPPQVLQHSPHSVNFTAPLLLLASGKGPASALCALPSVGPAAFLSDSANPAVFFNISEYGHVDFCDDVEAFVGRAVCPGGPVPSIMRQTTAGLIVSFLHGVVEGKFSDLNAVYADPTLSPGRLDPPQVFPSPLPW